MKEVTFYSILISGITVFALFFYYEKDYNSGGQLNGYMDYLPKELECMRYNISYYNTSDEGNSGEYYMGSDEIYLYDNRDDYTLLHEVGHRIHYHTSNGYKKEWARLHLTDSRYLTDYSKTDDGEDFADSFECYYSIKHFDYLITINDTNLFVDNCLNHMIRTSPERYILMKEVAENEWC